VSDLAFEDPAMASTLRGIENAVGIVQLRLCKNEWANQRGEAMLKGATTKELLAFIAAQAVQLRAELP
jgi:hypothetical protein